MPRAAPGNRGIGASRSFDPSMMGRGGGPPRTRSGDLNAMVGGGGGRPPPRTRSGDLQAMVPRTRSGDLQAMVPYTAPNRGRSISPSGRGRPAPERRGVAPSRSFDPTIMARGRSNSPSARGRPAPPQRGIGASRSMSPSRGVARARSMSPSRMRNNPNAFGAPPPRGRSQSPSRMVPTNAAAAPPPADGKKRRRGPHIPKRFKSFRRNRRGGPDGAPKVPAYNDPNRRRGPLGRGRKAMGRSFRRIAPKETCGFKKIMCYVIPILLMLTGGIGLIVVTGNASKVVPEGLGEKLSDLIPKFDNSKLEDPFSGTDVPKWNNGGGNGLTLKVLNALDDAWQVPFNLAISDWDFGTPDSLILSTERVAHDVKCEPVETNIKVCNGDYGEVPWRGINQATLDIGGFIIASAARMNQYYLDFEGDDARQYTMCHEIGHAFGLPHTDEDFDNEDLRNCLDYTNNFDVSKHPDASLYAELVELYGVAGTRRRRTSQTSTNLRSGDHTRAPITTPIPHHLRKKMNNEVEKLLAFEYHPKRHERIAESGWKLLHKARYGEEHELELGEGYKVRVQLLLAKPNL